MTRKFVKRSIFFQFLVLLVFLGIFGGVLWPFWPVEGLNYSFITVISAVYHVICLQSYCRGLTYLGSEGEECPGYLGLGVTKYRQLAFFVLNFN